MTSIGVTFPTKFASLLGSGTRAAHAKPSGGAMHRLGRLIREIPFVKSLPWQRAASEPRTSQAARPRSDAVHVDHLHWVQTLATEVTQTRQLQEAVRDGNVAGAKVALRRGADPDAVKLEGASPRMADLLSVARRVKLLYPDRPSPTTRGPTAARSAIDQLVQAYEVDGARAYLDNLSSANPQWLWQTARNGGREDLLRAMLAVGSDSLIYSLAKMPANNDVIRNSGLERGTTAGFLHSGIDRNRYSQALTDYLATIPGLDAALMRCVNGEGNVWCRHWAAVWMQQAAAAGSGESIDYSLFHGPDLLAQEHSVEDLEKRYTALRAGDHDNYLVSSDALGQFAADRFAKMKDGDSLQMMVCTGNHAMALDLARMNQGGSTVYVMRFYDPNLTTSHVVAEARHLDTVERLNLEHFVHVANGLQDYFGGQEPVAMVTIMPEGGIPETIPARDPDRQLAGWYGGHPLSTPTAVWHLFDQGFVKDLERLPEVIGRLDDDQAVALLSLQPLFPGDRRAASGFFRALVSGDYASANVYVRALQQCSPAAQQRVIEHNVLQFHGQAANAVAPDWIHGLGQLLAAMGWQSENIAQVLAMPTQRGGSTTYYDLHEGRADNLMATGNLMVEHGFSAEEWAAVLSPYHDGVSGIAFAAANGHAETIDTLATVLQRSPLTSAERMQVVHGAYDIQGVRYSGLEAAYRNNQPEALAAYGRLLASCLTPADGAQLLTDMLCAHHGNGEPMFSQRWDNRIGPETRAALADVLSRFSFSSQQATRIRGTIGIDVLALSGPPTAFIPRQLQRI